MYTAGELTPELEYSVHHMFPAMVWKYKMSSKRQLSAPILAPASDWFSVLRVRGLSAEEQTPDVEVGAGMYLGLSEMFAIDRVGTYRLCKPVGVDAMLLHHDDLKAASEIMAIPLTLERALEFVHIGTALGIHRDYCEVGFQEKVIHVIPFDDKISLELGCTPSGRSYSFMRMDAPNT